MMDEHDLTDPHGEAEALRRENARLRVQMKATLERSVGERLKYEHRLAASAWRRGYWQDRAEAAEAALAAAPVTDAQSVAWGQTGVRDRHGRMICVGDRIRVDLTSPATKREYWQPEYTVEWKPPAFKLRYVGGDKDSDTARWRFSTAQPDALEIISQRPPVQQDWKAMAEALRRENDRLREVLERLAKLGNGDRYGNSEGNMIARAALSDIAKMKGE